MYSIKTRLLCILLWRLTLKMKIKMKINSTSLHREHFMQRKKKNAETENKNDFVCIYSSRHCFAVLSFPLSIPHFLLLLLLRFWLSLSCLLPQSTTVHVHYFKFRAKTVYLKKRLLTAHLEIYLYFIFGQTACTRKKQW